MQGAGSDADADAARSTSSDRRMPPRRPGLAARQRDAALDLANGTNAHADVAFVCAVLSLLGTPAACVGGFVFGFLGVRRARHFASMGHTSLGRRKALWALGLSVPGTAITLLTVLASLGIL